MSAYARPMPRSSNAGIWFLLLGGLVLLAVLASTHAVINHGQAALDAQRCFSGGGLTMRQVMVDLTTGRTMEFCRDQQNRWFIKIDAPDGGNVTMFPRSFAKCLSDVMEYAKRAGFTWQLPTLP